MAEMNIWESARARRYPWDDMQPGDWFTFPEDVKLSSARTAAYSAGHDGRKFTVVQADGRLICRRIDGIASPEPEIKVRPSDTFPRTATYKTGRVKYPWKRMMHGDWFIFPTNIPISSARVMASNSGIDTSARFKIYRSVDGDLVCRRVDGLPDTEVYPRKILDENGETLLEWPFGGPRGTEPQPDFKAPGHDYFEENIERSLDMSRQEIKERIADAERMPSSGPRNKYRPDDWDKFPKFMAQNFTSPQDARPWCQKNMAPEEVDLNGCPIDRDHPFWRIN